MVLVFLPTALALPPQAEPDLSFQQTPLRAPQCTEGKRYTWEVRRETSGRAHGNDIQTGEEVDQPIATQMVQRVTLRCLSESPARAELTFAVPDAARGWSALPAKRTITLPAANTFTIEPASHNARTLREPLAWIFPPVTTGAITAGTRWDGAWDLEAGPWWGRRAGASTRCGSTT
jgi:hypothetical protein